jgi:hypothetical protein
MREEGRGQVRKLVRSQADSRPEMTGKAVGYGYRACAVPRSLMEIVVHRNAQ